MKRLFFTGCFLVLLAAPLQADMPSLQQAPSLRFPPLESLHHEPIKESKAFKNLTREPVSEVSKIAYLINRLRDTNIKIDYDGDIYPAKIIAPLAAAFLIENYRGKETAEHWVKRLCYRDLKDDNIIWVISPDGSRYVARDILLEELSELKKVLK